MMEHVIANAIGAGMLTIAFAVLFSCVLAAFAIMHESCNSKDDENKSE